MLCERKGVALKKVKRLITVGDSITVGTYFTADGGCFISAPNYAMRLKELLCADVLENRAISGVSYSATSPVMSDFAIATYCADIVGGDNIIVAAGTNDYGTNVVLGEPTDTEDVSFYGAVDYCLRTIKKNNPGAEMIVVLPLTRRDENIPNKAGFTLNDYRAAIAYKAQLLGALIVDGSKLPINPNDEKDTQDYIYDGVHFNEQGHEIIAEFIYREYCAKKV